MKFHFWTERAAKKVTFSAANILSEKYRKIGLFDRRMRVENRRISVFKRKIVIFMTLKLTLHLKSQQNKENRSFV